MSEQRQGTTGRLAAIEVLALETFAAAHGRTWKTELRHAWETGSYSGCADDIYGTLQCLRNSESFGPRGLIKYVARGLPAAEAAFLAVSK